MDGRRSHQRPVEPTTPQAHMRSARSPASALSGWSSASSEVESSVTPSSPSSHTHARRYNPTTPTRSASSVLDVQSTYSGLRIAPFSPGSSIISSAAPSVASSAVPRGGRLIPAPPAIATAATPILAALEDVGDLRLPRPLTPFIAEVLTHNENPLIRALFAATTENDRFEQLSHGAIVHDWYQLAPNTRDAIVHRIRQDLWNLACLLDRLTDTCTAIHIVEPEIADGHTHLDPDGPQMTVHVYMPRGVRTAPYPVQNAFRLMEEVFRHGIAAQHVRGFLARKEHLMVPNSRYRDQPIPTIIDFLPVRAFIAGPAVVDKDSNESWSDADLTASEGRFHARHQYVRRRGLPQLARFSAAVDALAPTRDRRDMIKRVVLDETVSSRPFEDWLLVFRTQFGLSRHNAAHLAMLGADDAEAEHWPL